MSKLSSSDLALYRAVDEALHYVWDPIGVSRAPEARDEYYSYIPHVFGMVKDGLNEQAIADSLGRIATDGMGLSARPEQDLEVARLLLRWKKVLDD